MLHDIDKLKAAHEKALSEAVAANALALSFPVPPARVNFADTALPWVSYAVADLAGAFDLLQTFVLAPWVVAKDGSCTVLSTWEHIATRYNVRHPAKTNYRPYEVEYDISDGAPYFTCQRGVGFGGTDMEFFATHNGGTVKVIVSIKHCPIRVLLTPTNRHPNCATYRKEYPHVPGARVIQWGYGDDCVRGTYWFSDMDTFWASMRSYVPEYATL